METNNNKGVNLIRELYGLVNKNTVRSSDLKAFLDVLVQHITKQKAEFANMSTENIKVLQEAVVFFNDNYKKWEEIQSLKTQEIQGLINQVKAFKPIFGKDGKDGVDGLDGISPDPKEIVPLVLKEIPKMECERKDTVKNGTFSKDAAETTRNTNVAHGLGATPTYVEVSALSYNGGYISDSTGSYDGSDNVCIHRELSSGSATSSGAVDNTYCIVIFDQGAPTNFQKAYLTVTSTNMVFHWTKGGDGGNIGPVKWAAFA